MNIQFQGQYRLFGTPQAIQEDIKQKSQREALPIVSHLDENRALLLTGQDTVSFLRSRLNIALEPRELQYLDPEVFAQTLKPGATQAAYASVVKELQGLADDAEDQQNAPDYKPCEGILWRSLSELMDAVIPR